MIVTELFKRVKGQWIRRTVTYLEPKPRVSEWLKSPYAQPLLNKSVDTIES